ncbi:hypothetical protein QBZ16_002532 [Prototheca wickerhamii]|uniref:Kinesin-like protein n=1 Tax=Prototheca wickerhamii TaxID=3111 RepID=A0AAD9IKG3_PROWI|nr:hypothetical protein QBZ16_002532 [Prototheca wickerhamii]
MPLLEEGERHRHVGETKMNKNSSRSHTIFRMVVESRSTAGGGEVEDSPDDFGAIRVSSLTLVDLAGSERIAKTGAEGQRAREGAAINKSLLTLGTVINRLSEAGASGSGHVPYRDSKLTRILQPALGGNARTAIICAVTPAAPHVEETHSTLRFACRAKRVVNNATVNEVLSDAAVLKRQAREIEELRGILQREGAGADVEAQINSLRAELLRKEQDNERMQSDLAAEKEERERAQRKIDSMTRLMLEGGGGGARGGSGKPSGPGKRENRRETWCPGASQRKRPLLLPGSVVAEGEGDEEEGLGGAAGNGAAHEDAPRAARRSEGAALARLAEESDADNGEAPDAETGRSPAPKRRSGRAAQRRRRRERRLPGRRLLRGAADENRRADHRPGLHAARARSPGRVGRRAGARAAGARGEAGGAGGGGAQAGAPRARGRVAGAPAHRAAGGGQGGAGRGGTGTWRSGGKREGVGRMSRKEIREEEVCTCC